MKSGRLVVSAPTSFGKTRLLEEILIKKQYKVGVIIFPTLALLAEQYKRLKSRPELSDYHISTSSKIIIKSTSKYILMLTPERLSLFLSIEGNKNVTFDFFCVDEVYKADQNQEGSRKYFFADAIYRLAKYHPKADFYLIGPYLNSFSAQFLEKFNAKFLKFKSEVVQKDYFDLESLKSTGKFPGVLRYKPKKTRIAKTLESLRLDDDSAKSLIFCKDKHTTELVAEYSARENIIADKENIELANYIGSSVSPYWSLVKYVKAGVAYHNGNIPRHIQELIVDAFDNEGGHIDILACTTTLIEGVNTNAKNIIFYDGKVADTPIDPFTLKNIEGRAGRLTRHFLGKIYYLDESLTLDNQDREGDLDVELEFFGDAQPSEESAVQLDREDLTLNGKEVFDSVLAQVDRSSIPIELLKSNKFISIERQIELINYLRTVNKGILDLSSYDTLIWILKLAHNHLFNDRDKMTNEAGLEKYLLPKSASYILHPVSLKRLIDEDVKWRSENRPNEPIDRVIGGTIKFYSTYIEYAWPRYLSAFDRLYNFVQAEQGLPTTDFDVLIAKLEYGSAEKHQILLREAGVPFEIIQKIASLFEECQTPEEVYDACERNLGRIKSILTNIEYRVLRFYI
jgi:hypothetical protein